MSNNSCNAILDHMWPSAVATYKNKKLCITFTSYFYLLKHMSVRTASGSIIATPSKHFFMKTRVNIWFHSRPISPNPHNRNWNLSNRRLDLFCIATLGALLSLLQLSTIIADDIVIREGGIFSLRLVLRRIWRSCERGVLSCCDERAWHDMTCVWCRARGEKRVYDVHELGVQS